MKTTRKTFLTLAVIVLVATVFRYWQIGEYPKAIHYDEVINGLVTRYAVRNLAIEEIKKGL